MGKQQVVVEVVPYFMAEASDIAHDRYAFAYQVRIRNLGTCAVRLLTRHWLVTDAHGQTQEVRGSGVVGEQPLIAPGAVYEYDSWTQLPTPWGSMRGSYGMQDEDGAHFDADIPAFELVTPRSLH